MPKRLGAEQSRWSLVRSFVESAFVVQTARFVLRAILLEAVALVFRRIALIGGLQYLQPEQDHRHLQVDQHQQPDSPGTGAVEKSVAVVDTHEFRQADKEQVGRVDPAATITRMAIQRVG